MRDMWAGRCWERYLAARGEAKRYAARRGFLGGVSGLQGKQF